MTFYIFALVTLALSRAREGNEDAGRPDLDYLLSLKFSTVYCINPTTFLLTNHYHTIYVELTRIVSKSRRTAHFTGYLAFFRFITNRATEVKGEDRVVMINGMIRPTFPHRTPWQLTLWRCQSICRHVISSNVNRYNR
jgi:hypothetical protein